MSDMISDELLRKAIDRIARTPDGRLQYLYLQRRLMTIPGELSDSALRSDQGERSFAFRLIGLMAKGISESGRPDSSGSSGSDEPLIVLPVAKSVAGGESRAARALARRTGPVAGWDDPADPDSAA